MWKRKELKEKARKVIKKNYWSLIVVCFIIAICTGEFGMSSIGIGQNNEEAQIVTNEVVEKSIQNQTESQEILPSESTTTSIKGTVTEKIVKIIDDNINSAIKSQQYIVKIVDAVDSFNQESILAGVTLCIGAVIAFSFVIFIADPLLVGSKRYLLKVRKSTKTKIGILVSIFQKEQWMHIAWVMLKRNIYTCLWYLTIIGGIIKTYEYKMIPYILAENPNIKTKEAFKLSKQMMHGNRWKTFVLDLSFIGWDILSLCTFGLLSILYVNPYIVTTNAELYIALKKEAIDKKYEYYEALEK